MIIVQMGIIYELVNLKKKQIVNEKQKKKYDKINWNLRMYVEWQ